MSDNPKSISIGLKELFEDIEKRLIEKNQIKKAYTDKDFLKNLIRIIEELNIFVFEFIDHPRKKEKTNFDGLFLSPNIIVIKRQKYYRREIFTLIHEFAHLLLDTEEIDEIRDNSFGNSNDLEKWCSTFSFYFLLGDQRDEFEKLSHANSQNEYYKSEISKLYGNSHLSHLAFYTRLVIENKIAQKDYDSKFQEITESIEKQEEEKRIKQELERQLAKEQGKPIIAIQKPIESNLFKEIVKINYFQGNIDEFEAREYLNVKPENSIEEVIF